MLTFLNDYTGMACILTCYDAAPVLAYFLMRGTGYVHHPALEWIATVTSMKTVGIDTGKTLAILMTLIGLIHWLSSLHMVYSRNLCCF
jgi:hypothetical protein